MLEAIRHSLRSAILDIEDRPPFTESAACFRTRRYPDDRGLDSYRRKLPDLIEYLSVGTRVLDIGAGKGIAAREIRDQFDCRVTATGFRSRPGSSIMIVPGIAAMLPFRDAQFDLVVSVQAISWEPDQVGAIHEVVRVLAPGGRGLLHLTPFSYSVGHRLGESFWKNCGVSQAEYSDTYEMHLHRRLDGVDMSIRTMPIKYPYRRYTYAFYIAIRK